MIGSMLVPLREAEAEAEAATAKAASIDGAKAARAGGPAGSDTIELAEATAAATEGGER
jgi:hypothetical protein